MHFTVQHLSCLSQPKAKAQHLITLNFLSHCMMILIFIIEWCNISCLSENFLHIKCRESKSRRTEICLVKYRVLYVDWVMRRYRIHLVLTLRYGLLIVLFPIPLSGPQNPHMPLVCFEYVLFIQTVYSHKSNFHFKLYPIVYRQRLSISSYTLLVSCLWKNFITTEYWILMCVWNMFDDSWLDS